MWGVLDHGRLAKEKEASEIDQNWTSTNTLVATLENPG
jgi:hypothetical protein